MNQAPRDFDYRLLVLTHGWIIMGAVMHDPDPTVCVMENPCVAKRWGTERGIGPLQEGPAEATVLDLIPGRVAFEEKQILFRFPMSADKWKSITWPSSIDADLSEQLKELQAARGQTNILVEAPTGERDEDDDAQTEQDDDDT